MTAARDDDFMALPGMEADSTDAHHGRGRLSEDTAPTSTNASSNASSKSALDALLDEYRARAKSEREKGTLFEELTRQFLLHDARFAHQFKEIYLWSEWPERRTGDTGIDLVAIPVHDGEGPVAIQCKFYALGHRIQKADIDSFLSASGKEPFGRRIVVDTSGAPWGKNAQDAIEGQQIPVSRITLADLRDSDIDLAHVFAGVDAGTEDPRAQGSARPSGACAQRGDGGLRRARPRHDGHGVRHGQDVHGPDDRARVRGEGGRHRPDPRSRSPRSRFSSRRWTIGRPRPTARSRRGRCVRIRRCRHRRVTTRPRSRRWTCRFRRRRTASASRTP